jgi:hypothetical protein
MAALFNYHGLEDCRPGGISSDQPMSIQNELSTDIAVALLTRKESNPDELRDLKEVVLRIHAALEATAERRRSRAHARATRQIEKNERLV